MVTCWAQFFFNIKQKIFNIKQKKRHLIKFYLTKYLLEVDEKTVNAVKILVEFNI